jgi:ParB family chromosome partitioning protein
MPRKAKTVSLSSKLRPDVFFKTSPDLPRIIEVDVRRLKQNPDQPRRIIEEKALRELADSIAQHGLIQPIAVAPDSESDDQFIVVAGERRWRACKLLERETIPAVVTEGNPDEIALIENIQRENLTPIEEAEALAKIMERHGYRQQDLGRIVGKAQNTVSETLQLNKLPQTIKDEYRTSDIINISKSALVELTRIKNKEEQIATWEAFKKSRLTVQTARARKNASARTNQKTSKSDPDIARLSNRLSEWFGASVKIKTASQGGGKIEITFNDIEECEGILEKFGFRTKED